MYTTIQSIRHTAYGNLSYWYCTELLDTGNLHLQWLFYNEGFYLSKENAGNGVVR